MDKYIDEEELDIENEELEEKEEFETSYDKKNNRVKFKSVWHEDRAEKYERITDGNTTKFLNIALEYFEYRCALSGEKFVKFDKKTKEGKTTNLSAEHMVPLCIGGDDIVPNLLPTVLQYNMQKNGYYPIDYWKQAKDVKENTIYSPYRLLKVINYMMKTATEEARESVREGNVKKFKKIVLEENEIDKYLKGIDKEKIYSETITDTEIDEDNKTILKVLPILERDIPTQYEQEQAVVKQNEIEMMDIFLNDAIEEIGKEKEIANAETERKDGTKITIYETLKEEYIKIKGQIPYEVEVRNEILKQIEKIGVKENKYSVANDILLNTEIINKVREKEENEEEIIKEYLKERIEHIEESGFNRENTIKLISIKPEILFDDSKRQEIIDIINTYIEKKGIKLEEFNIDLLSKRNFINATKIQEWMKRNNTTKPPRQDSKDAKEKKLGIALTNIRKRLIKPYEKLQTEEEKEEYKRKYSELEEVMAIVEEIDRNNIPIKEEQPHYINALKIQEWMKRNNTTKPPSAASKDKEEKRLGTALTSIRIKLIKPYGKLKTEEKKEEFRKKHPELEEVMAIVEEIDRNNILIKEEQANYINVLKIQEWMKRKNTTKPPTQYSKDEEEKRLGQAFRSIKQNLIKPYEKLQTEEEKEEYKRKHPELEEVMAIVEKIERNTIPTNLRNAYEIQAWMKENSTTKPPSQDSKDKEEKRLGNALGNIRQNLIKPYEEIKTEEKKEEYKREHPELEEVMVIVEEIDRNNPKNKRGKVKIKEKQAYYINALKIQEWMKRNNTTKPPSPTSKDEEEKKLGNALNNLKKQLINPYKILEIEEQKEEYKRKYPELEEVMAIVEEIDRNNIPIKEEKPHYINAVKIQEWMERNNTTKPPTQHSKDAEEKKLGIALANLKKQLINPYIILETGKQKEEYMKRHPELEEVMAIVEEIDRNNIPTNLRNAYEIQAWMKRNNTKNPPKQQSKDKEEKSLGQALRHIKQYLIKPYKILETEEQKEEYKMEHPELEEVMAIVEEIDKNKQKDKLKNKQKDKLKNEQKDKLKNEQKDKRETIKEEQPYYINVLKIQEWMKRKNTTKPPTQYSKDEEGKRLGQAFHSIKQNLIKPYKKLQTEEEKEEYKRKHPELEEVMAIVEEIDRNNIPIKEEQSNYINAIKIQEWMKINNTTKPPTKYSKDEEEKKLGMTLHNIEERLIKPYEILKTEKEKEEYKREHPELEEVMAIVEEIDRNNIPIKEEQPNYINAIKIQKWMKRNNTTKPPSPTSKDEEEKKLGRALGTIRQNLIKSCEIQKTEEEYKRKHPELEEVMAIVEEIDRNNIPIKEERTHYINALKIQKWMKDKNITKPPRSDGEDISEEEKRLGRAWNRIKQELIKTYEKLKTEEKKKEYKMEHPELEEVMAIVEEIDRNNIPIKEEQTHYINAIKIQEWMKKNNTTKLPSIKSEEAEEKILGMALDRIKQRLIKPYKILQTAEKKEEYKREHPELEEVMAIVEEIDRNKPRKNGKKITKEAVVEQKEKGELGGNKQIEEMFKGELKKIEKMDAKKDKNGQEIA